MSEEEIMRYIVWPVDGDINMVSYQAVRNNAEFGEYIALHVGPGNPFYAFASLPMEILMADEIGANFNGAPLASSDWQTNRNSFADQLANPVSVGETNDGINKVWVEVAGE